MPLVTLYEIRVDDHTLGTVRYPDQACRIAIARAKALFESDKKEKKFEVLMLQTKGRSMSWKTMLIGHFGFELSASQ